MQNLYTKMTKGQVKVFDFIRANILNEMYNREIELETVAFAYECNNGVITTSVTEFEGGNI